MLSILTRCAHEATQRLLREAVGDRHACIGTVASIQTFGSYAANFHPHVHALITEGVFHERPGRAPEFERVPWWDTSALTELYRRLVLRELRRAERLREQTESMLLNWQHSGFHVHAGEPVLPDDGDVRGELGGKLAPRVRPTGVVPEFTAQYVVYGGCPTIRDFDSIDPIAAALKSHEWVRPVPVNAAAGVVYEQIVYGDRKVAVTFPYGLSAIQNYQHYGGPSARAVLLAEATTFAGHIQSVVVPAPERPAELTVSRAYPNPFNPSTSVAFTTSRFGRIEAIVYNLRGERVRTLLVGELPAGPHRLEWTGIDDRGAPVASGVYLVQMQGFGKTDQQKVVLLK